MSKTQASASKPQLWVTHAVSCQEGCWRWGSQHPALIRSTFKGRVQEGEDRAMTTCFVRHQEMAGAVGGPRERRTSRHSGARGAQSSQPVSPSTWQRTLVRRPAHSLANFCGSTWPPRHPNLITKQWQHLASPA